MQDGRQQRQSTKQDKILRVILICLVLVIVGLTISLIWVNSNNQASETRQDSLIDTSGKMAGWDGPVSDSAKALVLAETIQDKLESDPDYNPPQALAEYQDIYNQATGNLKLYVAIEYAKYLYQTIGDHTEALRILNEVQDLVSTSNQIDYYGILYDIYNTTGDTTNADHYRQLLSEITKVEGPIE